MACHLKELTVSVAGPGYTEFCHHQNEGYSDLGSPWSPAPGLNTVPVSPQYIPASNHIDSGPSWTFLHEPVRPGS